MYHADIISTERPRLAALVAALNRLRDTPHAAHWPAGCFDVAAARQDAPLHARLVYVSSEPLSADVLDALRWYARAQQAERHRFVLGHTFGRRDSTACPPT